MRNLVSGTAKAGRLLMAERSEEDDMGDIPLMDESVLVDDQNASIIMVFPRGSKVGGTVDEEAIVENPLRDATRIFVQKDDLTFAMGSESEEEDPQRDLEALNTAVHKIRNQGSPHHGHHGQAVAPPSEFNSFASGPCTMQHYQDVVRGKVLEVLQFAGIQVSTFESIDGDEVFTRLDFAPDGKVLRQLAQHHQYRLPFRHEAYENMPQTGAHPGGEPMEDSEGTPVPAHQEFEFEAEPLLQPFRNVDTIKLLELSLEQWLNLSDMLQQGVVSKVFPAAKYDQVKRLNDEWSNLSLRSLFTIPNQEADDDIRDYFGELIAFYFLWYGYFVRALMPLAIMGAICALRKIPAFGVSLVHQRYIQIGFAGLMIAWASLFNRLQERSAARAKLRWGMNEPDTHSLERADYRPELEGTWKQWIRRTMADFIVVAYSGGFVALLVYEQKVRKWLLEEDMDVGAYAPLICVGSIYLSQFIWGKIAPKLADMQNHRTEARWNEALSYILTSVNLFVALYPFLDKAFLRKYSNPTCPHESTSTVAGMKEAFLAVFPKELPVGVTGTVETVVASITEANGLPAWLKPYTYEKMKGGVETYCIWGCYPVKCVESEGELMCVTNCMTMLEKALMLFFITHIVSTIAAVVIPIFLTKWEVRKEVEKVKGGKRYSFMQYQAKCFETAKYAFGESGGSYVEDFLELAISFALLTCFGVVLPVMALLAFLSKVVEYRLIAFRMVNVTCRPMPLAADGIGTWQRIFENICQLAVAVNVGIAVFVMHPMREWELKNQLLAFLVLEHSFLLIQKAIGTMMSPEPEDVKRCMDFNNHFKTKVVEYQPMTVPPEEQVNLAGEDIFVGPVRRVSAGQRRVR
mmetsp:Transcript_42886/g.127093  ORF Transcript_42886/g.127093 Transcript_42886/m.127093 type:complete len:859 (-) Transcript_42886:27-2603(-)